MPLRRELLLAAYAFYAYAICPQEFAVIKTNLGSMTVELYQDEAPKTVENFKALIEEKLYVGTTFYRVVKGHVIQAGTNDDDNISTKNATVEREVNSCLHCKGAVGLARGSDPNSGSTEFYICHEERPHLNGRYTIFAGLIDGFDVLELIAGAEVNEQWIGDEQQVAFHTPKEPIIIQEINVITE